MAGDLDPAINQFYGERVQSWLGECLPDRGIRLSQAWNLKDFLEREVQLAWHRQRWFEFWKEQ